MGNYSPVAILDAYMAPRQTLGWTSNSDFLFPNLISRFDPVSHSQMLEVQVPPASIAYDNYRKCLKSHFYSVELKYMGVYPKDHSTHSFGRVKCHGC